MLRLRFAACLAPALLLVGCSTLSDATAPGKPFTPVVGRPAGAKNTIFVSQGETLYDVAKRYNVPVRDLIDANNLKAPYVVTAGQRLILPVPKSYTVKAGDTIYGISRQYSMDMNEIVRLNNIQAPYTIRVGQVLRLPAGAGGGKPAVVAASAAGPTATAAVTPPPARKPQPAAASSPAGRSGTIESVPLEAPPAAPVPSAVPPTSSAPAARVPAAAPVAPPAAAVAAPPVSVAAPSPAPPAQTAALPVPEPPPSSGGKLLWPVSGTVLSEFGPKSNGQHNDGINIVVAKGAAVKAADDGVVAYAGNELKGFGNLILLRHADGWMTAYAHLDRMGVDRGALVKRGQMIGTVGDTGNVGRPQLHFEVRRGSRAVDPRERLAAQSTKG